MIFSNLIKKPKWQHRNPDIRQIEIENLDDLNILNEVAQNDEAPEVRQAALYKINDLSVLDQIAQHDTNNKVREVAEQRVKQLLCCQKSDCPALETRLNWVKETTDADRLAYIAEHGLEVELRLIAISKIEREGLLGDIAINDSVSEVRLAAVTKLSQKSTLERVYKATRSRDKRVSRLARDKLDQVIEQLERPERVQAECEAICTKLESLERRLISDSFNQKLAKNLIEYSKALKQEEGEFKRLQERWQAIAAEAPSSFQTRFTESQQAVMASLSNHQKILSEAEEREQAVAPIRAAKKELCEQLESILIELKNSQRLGNDEQKTIDQQFTSLQNQWLQTQQLDDPEEEQQWQARFERISQSAQKRHQNLQTSSNLANRLESTCAQAESLLEETTIFHSDSLKDLTARWQAYWEDVPKDKQELPVFSELNSRFDKALNSLKTRLQKQKEQRKQAVSELKQLLKELETALEEGELKTAIPLELKARQLYTDFVDQSASREQTLERRLHVCSDKIRELRSWQNWGNQLEREKLCQQVESLLETEENYPELVRLIEEAQTAWKRLGSSGYSRVLWERFNHGVHMAYQRHREYLCVQMEQLSERANDNPEETAKQIRQAQATWKLIGSQGHSQELWERFNQACQTAYGPCKIYFNNKAREREQSLKEKQHLCDRLEAFAQEADWENINWKEAYNFVRDSEKQWRNTGATDRKYKKVTQRRYQSVMQELETHLDDERNRNCRYRLNLISQVDEIAGHLKEAINTQNDAAAKGDLTAKKTIEDKINKAISEVKKLQDQWQVTVPGSRRVEREFWMAFRSACDVVFDFRKQQQEEQKKEIQAYLQSKTALCERVEQLADLEGEEIKTAPAQLKKLKDEWKNLKKDDWKNIGAMRKNKSTEAVDERFKKACRLVEKLSKSQQATERRQQIDLLKQKAALCIEIEQAGSIAEQDPDWLSSKQAAWDQLPKLEQHKWENTIEQRFQKACAIVSTGEPLPVSQKTLDNKEMLCVRMEILAGVDSPPESKQARLAHQVARLSAAMGGEPIDARDPQIEAEEIERDWYLSAAVSPEQTQTLEQRFSKASEVFHSKQ
jgi:exonuclease SbcC